MKSSRNSDGNDKNSNDPSQFVKGIGSWLGRTRFVVLIAVAAVMLVALSLFLLGTVEAFFSIWNAWEKMFAGNLHARDLTVEFLEVVTVMMKAVVFYLIGVGLYSLFISPLNVTVALGVLTLSDLEEKIINVIVVILAITFLQHFILWEDPLQTMYYGASLAMVVIALMLFQNFRHRVKEEQKKESPNVQAKAQKEMFEKDEEKHHITEDEVRGVKSDEEES
jgi:uncharacterized membrane protein YqhA